MTTTLDSILGSGALDNFHLAVEFENKNPPLIFEGEFVVTDPLQWPSVGTWVMLTVSWTDIPDTPPSTQNIFFKDRTLYWGTGICFVLPTYDLLSDFPRTKMWEFLTDYNIETMCIDLPDFYATEFLQIGFEISETDAYGMHKLVAPINSTCRIKEWNEWVRNGSDPLTQPAWRQ